VGIKKDAGSVVDDGTGFWNGLAELVCWRYWIVGLVGVEVKVIDTAPVVQFTVPLEIPDPVIVPLRLVSYPNVLPATM